MTEWHSSNSCARVKEVKQMMTSLPQVNPTLWLQPTQINGLQNINPSGSLSQVCKVKRFESEKDKIKCGKSDLTTE
jgi:hypothetical protein